MKNKIFKTKLSFNKQQTRKEFEKFLDLYNPTLIENVHGLIFLSLNAINFSRSHPNAKTFFVFRFDRTRW